MEGPQKLSIAVIHAVIHGHPVQVSNLSVSTRGGKYNATTRAPNS